MLYIRVFAGGQRSSDVICFCNPEEEASIFMSPDEHFESLNTVLILSINVHWLYGNGEEGTKETQRANWS